MRLRITERIARAAHFPVALIVAPAGFGKTVALRDYLATLRIDVIRYDVPREDATLQAFAYGLARALEPIIPHLAEHVPTTDVAEWFAEHLRRAVVTIVIDDLHHACVDADVAPLLVKLIERTGDRVRWILTARSDVGLPVASWVGYGRMDVPVCEDDLRFTPQEALAAASDLAISVAPEDIESLRELTDGWPVALTIALRTRTHATDLRAATAGTREMVYRYLAEQIYSSLNDEQRQFLLRTCIFPSFDAEIVSALGADASFIAALKRGAGFLSETSPGLYRYHDLFRDFLEHELQRTGEMHQRAVMIEGGIALMRQYNYARALALFIRAKARDEIATLLARHGIALYERGESDMIDTALVLLSPSEQRADARILGLKAMFEAGRGTFELAERDFTDAIACAKDMDVRIDLVHRHAIERIRHGRDATALLASFAQDAELTPALRVPLLGTYATALARGGELDRAMETVTCGLDLIDATVSDEQRARFYQQAAYVHNLWPGRREAKHYARVAIDLAEVRGLYDVVARANSVLYTIAYEDDDDPIESLSILDRLIEAARKSGSQQARLYGLMASYDIEAERGNDVALIDLEGEIAHVAVPLEQTRTEAMLPAMALHAAWGGDFERAYHTLAGTSEHLHGDRRALRAAEIALYAFASGRTADGVTALREASTLVESTLGRRAARTYLVIGLCELLRGQTAAVHRAITEAERRLVPRSKRLQAFSHVLHVLHREALNEHEPAIYEAALERLRAHHLGGIAQLITALPLGVAVDGRSYALLTSAERAVLIELAAGASSKKIAAESGRSPQTIDTHVRSICRKLRCRGRREAITLALRAGWVST